MRPRGPLPAVVLLCAVALAAGCARTPPPPARAAGRLLRPLSDDVRRAYLAYWDAWLKANRTSNPDEPSLAAHATSPQLDVLRANLAEAREQHRVTRGTVGHRLEGMEGDGDARRVVDCIDLDHWLLHDAVTNQQLDQLVDKPSQLAVFALRRHGRGWWVTSSQVTSGC
jgi:hypothetical protein